MPLPESGQVIGGKYRIEEKLGKGGMGAVFRATHVVSAKQVALKWMLRPASDERARQRFTREARAAGRIDHPNVVDVYDIGQDGDASYLVMELLRGESLRDRLARGRLSPSAVVDLLLPAMRGVAAAHREGVIHRDLKPDNVFLCRAPDGQPREAKVLDFGISAVSTPEPDAQTTLTKEGAVLGTPAYMSPEQLESVRSADARTDVYAFGVILYQALTGSLPFEAESYSALVVAIVNADPLPPRRLNTEIPVELERVVLKALEKDRDRRVPSMEALIAAVQPFASAKGEAALDPISLEVERFKPFGPRRGRRTAAALVPLLLVLGALAWWALRVRAPDAVTRDAVAPASVTGPAAEPARGSTASPTTAASSATALTPPGTSSTTVAPSPAVQPGASAAQRGGAGSAADPSPAVGGPAPDKPSAVPNRARRPQLRSAVSRPAARDTPEPAPTTTSPAAPTPKTTNRRTPNLSLEDF
jgi:serine/threonine-protein kinase